MNGKEGMGGSALRRAEPGGPASGEERRRWNGDSGVNR